MSDKGTSHSDWYGSVLYDLADAFRRDGLSKTAELLDDAGHQLLLEQAEVTKARIQSKNSGLKLVGN